MSRVDAAADTASPNAIGRALGLVGDEWTLLIVRYALAGARRFTEWKTRLGIADPVLAARLAGLVQGGILAVSPSADRPDRSEYRLTDAGRDLWRVLVSIWGWELVWVECQADVLPTMRHRDCERDFRPLLACAACNEPANHDAVTIDADAPGAIAGAVPAGSTRRRSGRRGASGPGLFPETMALVGNRWSSALLGAAFLGARRFGEFHELLGAPPATVSARLRTFTSLGVLDADYCLTAKGDAFFPVVANVVAWGERWFGEPGAPVLDVRHIACGEPFVPVLQCSACRGLLRRETVLVEPTD